MTESEIITRHQQNSINSNPTRQHVLRQNHSIACSFFSFVYLGILCYYPMTMTLCDSCLKTLLVHPYNIRLPVYHCYVFAWNMQHKEAVLQYLDTFMQLFSLSWSCLFPSCQLTDPSSIVYVLEKKAANSLECLLHSSVY